MARHQMRAVYQLLIISIHLDHVVAGITSSSRHETIQNIQSLYRLSYELVICFREQYCGC